MKPIRRLAARGIGDTRGQTTLEFALVFMLLFTTVFAIIQGGLLFNGWLTVTQAARETARQGATCYGRPGDPCDEGDLIALAQSLSLPGSTVEVEADTGARRLRVRVEYGVTLVAPMFSAVLDDPFPVASESEMRLENVP